MERVSEKELNRLMDEIRCEGECSVALDNMKTYLMTRANDYAICLDVVDGVVCSGLFSSKEIPCLVLKNPYHVTDYYSLCVSARQQGKFCFLNVSSFGRSKQMGKEAFLSNVKVFDGEGTKNTAAGIMRGGALGVGWAIGSAVAGVGAAGVKALAKGYSALTQDKNALAEEKDWYSLLLEIIEEQFA